MAVEFVVRVLGAAPLLGILGDTLLRADPWGLNVFLGTTALVVVAALLLPRARSAARHVRLLLLLPPLFAVGVAWRAAPLLSVWNMLAVAGTLALPVMRTGNVRLPTGRPQDYAVGLVTTGVRTAIGPLHLAAAEAPRTELMDQLRRRRVTAVALGLVLATPLLAVFGLLLVSADAGFDRLVQTVVDFAFQEVVLHLVGTAFVAWISAGYLMAVFVGAREPAIPWMSGVRPVLGAVELGIPLGGLALLFSVFVVTQAGYVFGGDDLIRESANLGYAEYARRGFFELVAVAVLILPVLLAADWITDATNATARRTVRVLSGALLLLVGLIMVSALHRMWLYLDAYGLTQDRGYAMGVLLWAGIAIAWFAATVLQGRSHRFVFGAMVGALAVLGLLNAINLDAMVVRTNVARARAGAELDADYLASLSADAVPALVRALPDLPDDAACVVLEALAQHEESAERPDWRGWHLARARARDAATGLAATRAARCAAADGNVP